MRFGISTHLYHQERLGREHLAEIAAHGFSAIELFATRSHFDYHDQSAIETLAGWLEELGLELHGVHAPVFEEYRDGRASGTLSTASADPGRRAHAMAEARAALEIVRHIAAKVLVVHLGVPDTARFDPGENDRGAALRSLEELADAVASLDVRLAVEVIPNRLSTPSSLVRLLEEELEIVDPGVCLDFGHAFLMGDLADAIETTSGHLITTHLHDNGGTRDEHLVPFDGAIEWAHALMAVRKIGYDGMLLFELGNAGNPAEVLARAVKARDRIDAMLRT